MLLLRTAIALTALLLATPPAAATATRPPADETNPSRTPEYAAAVRQLVDCARESRTDWRVTVHDGHVVLCEPPTNLWDGWEGWDGWDAYFRATYVQWASRNLTEECLMCQQEMEVAKLKPDAGDGRERRRPG